MNKLPCFLTGGHRYKDENLRVYRCDEDEKVIFRNYCTKCHKPVTTAEIPIRDIIILLGGEHE